jgi:hypothetical protein
MNESRERSSPAGMTAASKGAPLKSLRFESLDSNVVSPTYIPGPWRAGLVYLAAGAAYALFFVAAWILTFQGLQSGPIVVILDFWTYYWPAIVAVILVAAEDRKRKIWIVLGYVAVYIAIAIVRHRNNPDFTWRDAAVIWIIVNGPATVLLYLFLMRRIRSVGPLVLVFAIIAVLGSNLTLLALYRSPAIHRAVAKILGSLGSELASMLLGLLLFAVLGWLALRWIGARYSAKKFSDESLTVDFIFLLFGLMQSMFVPQIWIGILTGLVACIAYKVVARIGFAFLPKMPSPKRLLLLRVFALGKRSERLFDAVRKVWLRGGALAMIAGPDLVTSAVEPYEFLEFLSGKLGRNFVGGDADLARCVAAMDSRPDPDGRYRISQFFCRANTWQSTMRWLIAQSNSVLMDLRSFSASNQGCVYELGRLLDAIELGHVVFVIDKRTDRGFLEATLQQHWATLANESPNRSFDNPTARFFEVRGPTAGEIRALTTHLLCFAPTVMS